MYILGFSCYYHDASAALLKDGIVVAAASEERFTRKKHDPSFPRNAIRYCLDSQEITIDDIDHVAFYEKPFLKFERILHQHLEMFPRSFRLFLRSTPPLLVDKMRVLRKARKVLKYTGDVHFIGHHLSHASSCFLPSPFESAAILTADGVGEWTTTTLGHGKGTDISLHKELDFPHSLGLLYSTITAYLGFRVNNSEYKVMGLAAYGNTDRETNRYYNRLLKILDLKADGSFRLDTRYFSYHYSERMPSRRLCRLLGGPVRKPESDVRKRHKDIAAAVQMLAEDVIIRMLDHLYEETKESNLVLAGGVALNSVINGRILSKTPFENIWIQPNASDGGASLGAALFVHNTLLGNRRNQLTSPYLGPSFSAEQVRAFLERNNITFTEFENNDKLIDTTARLIHENNVVGWFQGSMEWGPRALGARSILADPTNPRAKDVLNEKVKHRESFRPFAPVVCREDADTYFACDDPLPEPADYMLMVYDVKEQWREKLPSITHVDGSARLQTVSKEQHGLYYSLIKRFGNYSGIPMLINTSFNIRGEPIVCTPEDAYRCMMGTGIDYLVIERFLISREDNPGDKWNSENHVTE
ncbi:MAG: carbamoyltransferase [Candidatus Woesearchaeota archaeon]